MSIFRQSTAIAALLAASACNLAVNEPAANQAGNTGAPAEPGQAQNTQNAPAPQLGQAQSDARAEYEGLRFVVDISDRKVRLLQGDRQIAEHDVAVGSQRWPTPTGSWNIHRVDLNPDWNPPQDESWSEDREPKAPGEAGNPMGRARLVYRMPNTIHGTEDRASLGKAVSHGSIRVGNDVVLRLAEILLRAGGAWEGPDWFRAMTENRTRMMQIQLPYPVPIEVRE
ncbi:MAG TPA: L,D-transpeptidase [Allosphingosinicella sp.]|nr:L,D-transpeptidase [Allosphingosinicella sp.]